MSSNGFVHKIHYQRNNYHAYAIVKSSARSDADNLSYEYLVGKFLNRYQDRFPLFVETYALYSYVNESSWNHSRITKKVEKSVFFKNINLITNEDTLDDEQIKNTCSNSKHLAILIQNIQNAKSLNYLLDEVLSNTMEVIFILFHIYSILHTIRDSFTHYDLHLGNVLIYTLEENKHIKYIYHTSTEDTSTEEIIEFKSKYMVKIIDYGRSFFPDAMEYHKKICLTQECKSKVYSDTTEIDSQQCGNEVGYDYLNEPVSIEERSYILSTVNNQSHDLRLIKNLITKINSSGYKQKYEFINKHVTVVVKYPKGTPEIKESGLYTKINNITDAFKYFKECINLFDLSNESDSNYNESTQIGELHIYLHNENSMEFIPSD